MTLYSVVVLGRNQLRSLLALQFQVARSILSACIGCPVRTVTCFNRVSSSAGISTDLLTVF